MAAPGRAALAPGRRAPSGSRLAGASPATPPSARLKLAAGGRAVPGRWGLVDMCACRCDVRREPGAGDTAVASRAPAAAEGCSAGASATAQVAVLNWNQVLLYPRGTATDDLTFE